VGSGHDKTGARRARAAYAAEPLRKNLSAGSCVGGEREDAASAEIPAASAVAHDERIGVGGIGAPLAQKRLQREGRIGRGRVAQLILRIDAVTIRACPHFAWAEGNPIALLDHTVVVVRSGKLAGHSAVGG